jgi:hypothetical protein
MLLILTSTTDLAADYLIIDLIKQGLPYFRLNAEELADADYTFALDRSSVCREMTVASRTLVLSGIDAVWYRRAMLPNSDPRLSGGERAFVAGELRHLVTGLVMNPEVNWVNPIDKVYVAEHKLYQLQVARRLGFRVPRTIVSRDSVTLQHFAAANLSGTICKPIFHGLFFDNDARYSIYTRRVTPETLNDADVAVCPVLLQEEIPRKADVRATFIGSQCFVADIQGGETLVDWRDPQASVRYSVSSLSDEVMKCCRAMLVELGLIYGAFDFLRTPDDDLVFLEINPTGEWAWLEDRLGFPMRDAFIELFFGRQK